jgi:hypothetical protein
MKKKKRKAPKRPRVATNARGKKRSPSHSRHARLVRLLGLARGETLLDPGRLLRLSETQLVLQASPGRSHASVRADVRSRLGQLAIVEPVFPGYREGQDLPVLRDFFLVRIPDLPSAALDVNPFDIAYALADATKSVGAMPAALPSSSSGGGPPNPCQEPESSPPVRISSWHLIAANVPAAWDILAAEGNDRGGGTLIAQADTGVVQHVLLDGRLDLRSGADLLQPGQLPIDPLPPSSQPGEIPGHGTFGATIIAGAPVPEPPNPTPRDRALAAFSGVAPEASILPVRCTRNVVVNLTDLARAIHYATTAGAHVISIALGNLALTPCLSHAVSNAAFNDILIVAAAGQCEPVVVMPAAHARCLAVAGTKLKDTSGDYSTFEKACDLTTLWERSAVGFPVDIAAPAKDIVHGSQGSLNNAMRHTALGGPSQGTTFATAILAGIAALWRKHHGRALRRFRNFKTLQNVFRDIVRDSARRPPGWHTIWGPGIVDAAGVLSAPLPWAPPSPPAPGPFIQSLSQFRTLDFFEQSFAPLDPAAIHAALQRLFGGAADWQAQLDRFATEIVDRFQADPEALRQFIETARAEATARAAAAAADAAAAAEAAAAAAAETVERVAEEGSNRLRGALGV